MRILLAEDDAVARAALVEILNAQDGWTVIEAVDGNQAWAALERGPSFDICFFDIAMPGIDGLELVRRMHQLPLFKDVPVVITSMSRDRATVLEAAKQKVSGYLVKPVDKDRVLDVVRKLVAVQEESS